MLAREGSTLNSAPLAPNVGVGGEGESDRVDHDAEPSAGRVLEPCRINQLRGRLLTPGPLSRVGARGTDVDRISRETSSFVTVFCDPQ